jgi:uncharacterized protein YndB with AHSA1/START domain
VLVRSDRRYRFPVSPEQLWQRLHVVDDYRLWWPWLRHLDADRLASGDTWSCAVQPPVPYSLRFEVELQEVEPPGFVVAAVAGDIVGTARLDTTPADEGCEVRLRSELAPGNRYLQAVARVAGPVVRFGHDWVLDTGARQFGRRALEQRR